MALDIPQISIIPYCTLWISKLFSPSEPQTIWQKNQRGLLQAREV